MIAQPKLSYESPTDPVHIRLLTRAVEYATGRGKLGKLYDRLNAMELEPREVWTTSLELLGVTPVFDKKQLAKIPSEGPLIVIANHPFGVVDGLIIGALTAQIRDNFVVMVHELLCRQDPRLNQFLLPIDFRENRAAMETNLTTRKIALERMRQGEALVIFPSGGVMTSPNGFAKAEDLEWKRFTAKVIQMAKATVIPIFVHGENSRLFQLVSQVSQVLRMSLLLNEVRNKMGKEVHLTIGDPIPFEELASIKDRQQLLDHLKEITFNLENHSR